jgi:hypothetical protein
MAVATAVTLITDVEPLIVLVTAIIKAHFNATGSFPDPAAVQAAMPADSKQLGPMWGAWTNLHPTPAP